MLLELCEEKWRMYVICCRGCCRTINSEIGRKRKEDNKRRLMIKVCGGRILLASGD
jgi:hypothetical protein